MASTSPKLWTKFDRLLGDVPSRLIDETKCVYARERISGGGYAASEANSLIANFKIPPNQKSSNRWYYKQKACDQFAKEIASLIPKGIAVCAIPGSKDPSDVDYDPRFEMTLAALKAIRPDVTVCQPIVRQSSISCAHHGGSTISDDAYKTSLSYVGFGSCTVPDKLVLIDDVITSGRQFVLSSEVIDANVPGLAIYGVFWARSIR